MIDAQTTIGTICHDDDNANDKHHRRIEIWADRSSPQRQASPTAGDVADAVRIAGTTLVRPPAWALVLSGDL